MAPAESELPRGTTLGRYLVLETLGAGSSAVVYAAYDPQLDRKIALKLLRADAAADGEEGRKRLLREAQAMARLSHPNVVQVYDAGQLPGRSDDGTPREQVFIAMEHVAGRTLRAWLAEKARSVPEILVVFEQAGRGLAAAHAAGIVHRDFKPENVLVDAQDRARVTDFGLARSAARRRSASDLPALTSPAATTVTATGLVLGTPAYAAPEQFTGDPVDHRTDQFSFCVALYEALYGERPFLADTEAELVFVVTMGRFRPIPKDSRVPGWLHDLVLRGLSPAPEKRHPSMDRLLHALGRRPARRRRWIAAGVLSVAIGLAATGLGAVMMRRAELCRGAGQSLKGIWDDQRRRQVEAALLATGMPFAKTAAQRAVQGLDEYAAAWSAMYTESCRATRIRGEQTEALMDLRMRCLGRRLDEFSTLVDLFAHADARLVERAGQAVEGLRDLRLCADREALQAVVEPSDERLRGSVDAGRREIDRARSLYDAGRFAEALRAIRPVVDQARALGYRPLLAEALLWLGNSEVEVHDLKAAEETLHQAVREAEVARDDETRARAWTSLVRVTGGALMKFEEARRCAQEAGAVVERLGSGHEDMQAQVHFQLGYVLCNEGQYFEALAEFQAALSLRERALPRSDTAILLDRLSISRALAEVGRVRDSVAEKERLIPALEAMEGPEHPNVAALRDEMGGRLGQLGRYRESLAQHERALAARRAVLGEQDPHVSYSLVNIAIARARLGHAGAVLSDADEALRRTERLEGRSFNWTLVSDDVAEIRRMAGDFRSARAQGELTLEVAKKVEGPDNPIVAMVLKHLGECDLAAGRAETALAEFRQAAAVHLKRLPPEHLDLSRDLGGQGRALLALRRPAEALPVLERANQSTGELSPGESGEIAFALARARWDRGQREQAVKDAEAALEVLSRGEGIDRLLIPDVEKWLQRRRGAPAAPRVPVPAR
jgi:tetratricopeptide (TPR) repeat protein/tRNA A-37 threonylcarbamoyl transferase component Bud32